MSNKTEANYKAVFMYIHENVMSLNCELFMTDYERAMRNGLSAVVPNAEPRACWFHFTQATKRNAKKLSELMQFINTSQQGKEIYYHLLCLPFLPEHLIIPAFEKLKLQANALHPRAFKRFLIYFENQWLINVRKFYFSFICFSFICFSFICLISKE